MSSTKRLPQKIVGIDASLTNTAMYFGPGKFAEIKGGKLRGATRLQSMFERIREQLREHKPTCAVIEGYAYMANARQHRLGEIGGVVRLACALEGVKRIYEVPPTSLKKFFTGNGKASKKEMQEEAVDRQLFKAYPSDDLADACALWYAGDDNKFLNAKAEREDLGK